MSDELKQELAELEAGLKQFLELRAGQSSWDGPDWECRYGDGTMYLEWWGEEEGVAPGPFVVCYEGDNWDEEPYRAIRLMDLIECFAASDEMHEQEPDDEVDQAMSAKRLKFWRAIQDAYKTYIGGS